MLPLRRAGSEQVRPSFSAAPASRRSAPASLLERLVTTLLGLRRTAMTVRRAEAVAARIDTRAWVVQRRERTRHMIELGGLVQKAGLVELMQDDRAAIYGALLELADRLGGDEAADLAEL